MIREVRYGISISMSKKMMWLYFILYTLHIPVPDRLFKAMLTFKATQSE